MVSADVDEPLHVLDLPQIYTKPSGADILKALDLLEIKPRNFGTSAHDAPENKALQSPGISRYLTSIISSSLSWLESDEQREAVWDAAAARLSERSGRAAMRAMSRVFTIPASHDHDFMLTLHEPSITADDFGMKTWVSSYLLSHRLQIIFQSTSQPVLSAPSSDSAPFKDNKMLRALELGSGTGLVGLSFAALHGKSATVHLTDLPTIVNNLAHNVDLNSELLDKTGATVTTGVLDWSVPPELMPTEQERYNVILAADPLYSPDHPKWLVDTISHWLSRELGARAIVEMPLRDAYSPQVQEFRKRMGQLGLSVVDEGEEVGYDDWVSADGSALEVRCWWSIWCWSERDCL